MPRFRTLAEVPILILTGHGSEEIAARALRAHAADYLMKPFTLGELRASVARAVRPPSPPPDPADPFARVHCHTTGHLAEPHTTTSLAQEVGVSERHLRRLFQDSCGHTPRCHLAVLRVRQAADLLDRSRLGIKQVVDTVGFANLRTFGRAFKQIYGVTPATFRGRARRGDARQDAPTVRP
jgi:transcriptional regulator GlxA family with amidase domain